jgi:hypothetical protein
MGRFAIKTGKMLFAVDDGARAFSGALNGWNQDRGGERKRQSAPDTENK